eukprot:288361_1
MRSKHALYDKCESIHSCKSINIIAKYLHQYESIKLININKIFNKDSCPHLSDHFNHILTTHLRDNKSIQQSNNELELIHAYIMQKIQTCKLEHCSKYKRNNRNRERENILSISTNIIDHESEYYIELLDTIHCFFVHTFDCGFRIHSDVFNDIISINKHQQYDEINDDIHHDKIMTKLRPLLQSKRDKIRQIRGVKRTQNTKFITKTESDLSAHKSETDIKLNNNQMTS